MKLEPRYIVLKLKDIKAASVSDQEIAAFNIVCDKVSAHRIGAGKSLLECMVIEKDWPEFKPALAMLEARVEGRENTEAKLTAIVRAFLDKHHVSCAETIHQTDRVIENAYGLIEELADVVGYYQYPDGD